MQVKSKQMDKTIYDGEEVSVNVLTLNNGYLNITFNKTITVIKLKELIEKKFSEKESEKTAPASDQCLIYQGMILTPDSALISDFGVLNNSCLHLVPRFQPAKPVIGAVSQGYETLNFQFNHPPAETKSVIAQSKYEIRNQPIERNLRIRPRSSHVSSRLKNSKILARHLGSCCSAIQKNEESSERLLYDVTNDVTLETPYNSELGYHIRNLSQHVNQISNICHQLSNLLIKDQPLFNPDSAEYIEASRLVQHNMDMVGDTGNISLQRKHAVIRCPQCTTQSTILLQ